MKRYKFNKITTAKWMCFFLDFIDKVKFQIICLLLLIFLGLFMYNQSTKTFSPELKEYKLYVDEATTSPKDTIKAFYLECYIAVDALKNDITGKIEKDMRSYIRAAFSYNICGTNYDSLLFHGHKPLRKIGSGTSTVVYKWFKALCAEVDITMMDKPSNYSDTLYQTLSFPDSLSYMLEQTKGRHISFLLGRTVNCAELEISILSPTELFSNGSSKNPYILTYFNFDTKNDIIDIDSRSKIHIKTGSNRKAGGELPNPINIYNVWPQPDHVGPDGIYYETIESVTNALKNGIYISAENLNLRNEADRKVFLFTLLLGVVITLLVEIVIYVIRKWRIAAHVYYDKLLSNNH